MIRENYTRGIQQKRWPIQIVGIYPESSMKLGKFKHTLLIRPKQWAEYRGLQTCYIVQISNEIAGLELLQDCNRVTIYCGEGEQPYRDAEIRFGWAGTDRVPLRLTARQPIQHDLYLCWGTGVEIQRFSKRHNMIKGGVSR